MSEDRLKLYRVSAQAAVLLFQNGAKSEVVTGIPDGAEFEEAGYNQKNRCFYITVSHESFDPISEAESIPEGEIIMQDIENERRYD